MFHSFREMGSKKVPFIAGLMVAASLLGATLIGVGRVNAANCTANDIMFCGFSSSSDFISKVQADSDGHGHNDLQAIYAHFGLSESDYDDFAQHAVLGKAIRNGDIIVNGKTVGTSGMSLGRQHFDATDKAVTIGGNTYYTSTNAARFADGVDSLSVYVLFDSAGVMKFAVMPSCGNPESANVPKPVGTASCSVLNKTPVSGQANTYDFTAAAAASGSAKILRYVYNFGDGSPTVTQTSGTTAVRHTYTTPGTFTATVTVFADVPGNPNMQLPAVSMCAKQITVQAPPPAVAVACEQLTAIPADTNKMSFNFTATARSSGGATLASADFDFGDGNTQTGVNAASGANTVSATHTYATAGTFTASAVLHFTGSDGKPVTAPACTFTVSPVAPPAPPAPTPAPPAPVVVLPNTGAGNTIALFSVVVIAGYVGYRQLLIRRHKNND